VRVIELRVHARRLTKLLCPTVLSTSLLSANCRLSPGKTSFQRKQSFRQFTNFPTRTLDFSLFRYSWISTNESFVIIHTIPTLLAKTVFSEKSVKMSVIRQNVRSTKCPSAKCPFGKVSTFGEVSSDQISASDFNFGKVHACLSAFGKMSGVH
jgi:hypothetical protein